MASSFLGALFGNESGLRNIANTTQGTSSGQAQGYFQITTGTWADFGGLQYAPTPLQATYAQQAAVASTIPLGRWDNSTINAITNSGFSANKSQTLGQNVANNGDSFGNYNPDGSGGANVGSTADDEYSVFNGGSPPSYADGAATSGVMAPGDDGVATYANGTPAVNFNDLSPNTFDGASGSYSLGTGGTNQPGYVGSGTDGLGGAVGGTGGQPIDITDLPATTKALTGAGQDVKTGLTTTGSDIQQSAGGIVGTFTSAVNALEDWTSSAFVIIALVVMGLIFVGAGLKMFGSRLQL